MARLGAVLIAGADFQAALRHVELADRLGYDSLWVTQGNAREVFCVLTAYAGAAGHIGLGTAVVPIYPRHPTVLAQQALTLNEISGGRFRLGIGVSHRPSMEGALGLDMGSPLASAREYVEVLRQAFTGSARHQGARYRVEWSYGVSPPPPAPPLLLSGLSPKMIELAAEIADGVVLWLATPEYVRDVVIPAVRRGRQRAVRSADSFEIVCPVPAAITDEADLAWTSFRTELVRYLSLPFYQKAFRLAGYDAEVDAFLRDRESREPQSVVPARFAEGVGAIGSAETVQALTERFRQAGATLPVIRPVHPPAAKRTLEEAIS